MRIPVTTTKILVVEDEKTQRRLLSSQLQSEGYEVIEAADGREGLNSFLADPEIRLVITDLVMPEMNGYQLVEAIRDQEARYTYIIVLTAEDERAPIVKALSLGADDYLTKPLFKDELYMRLTGGRRLLKLESRDELVLALAKLAGTRSGETGAHLDRVSAYCMILARDLSVVHAHLGLSLSFAEEIAHVSPLHDIGKVAIPDSVLHKPSRLTNEEFNLMKTHATVGGNILKDLFDRTGSTYLRMAYEVALHHHERWDGKGYPAGLNGADIPLAARIMTLADVFDALTANRCYKDAFPYDQAKEIILEENGFHFDPMVVSSFLRQEEEWVKAFEQF